MGTHDINMTLPATVAEKDLATELAQHVKTTWGVHANLTTYGLVPLSKTPVTLGQGHALIGDRLDALYAADEDAYFGSGTGFYVPVYGRGDVTQRVEKFTVTVDADTLDYNKRVPQATLDALAAERVTLGPGEFIEDASQTGTRVLARKVTTTVPKEDATLRYYVVVNGNVDLRGPGHDSQSEARKAAEKAAKDASEHDSSVVVIDVIAVKKRVSGAPLLTVTSTPTQVEVRVSADIAVVKPGARQADWLVYGSYHH